MVYANLKLGLHYRATNFVLFHNNQIYSLKCLLKMNFSEKLYINNFICGNFKMHKLTRLTHNPVLLLRIPLRRNYLCMKINRSKQLLRRAKPYQRFCRLFAWFSTLGKLLVLFKMLHNKHLVNFIFFKKFKKCYYKEKCIT